MVVAVAPIQTYHARDATESRISFVYRAPATGLEGGTLGRCHERNVGDVGIASMSRARHEFRDPVHSFIGVSDDERLVVDSVPVQRLRHIHQLAMSYLVYPGATHRRFEHSLGVMELAGRVFDTVTDQRHWEFVPASVRERLLDKERTSKWRRTLRAAALCHDVGHLPFSHAAESELLPSGWTHERITIALIRSEEMSQLWNDRLEIGLRGREIAKLAVGPKHFTESLDVWESVLSEIITGDAFGVDRMDYLLRDSLHAGVAYGRFDHYRLIDSLRILPKPQEGQDGESEEPQLGIEQGGLQSAEALLMARYFMYSQVYFHRVRRIFDIHLKDFLKEYLKTKTEDGFFPTDPGQHLGWTDAEITAALLDAARDQNAAGHDAARRIVEREPYKLLWARTSSEEVQAISGLGEVIAKAAKEEFGEDAVRSDHYSPSAPYIDFPVQRDGTIVSARAMSSVLKHLPPAVFDVVFIHPNDLHRAKQWLEQNREDLLRPPAEEE